MILILGGTSEAAALARLLAASPGIKAMLSLAGRTQKPGAPTNPLSQIGGFGGVEGLCGLHGRRNGADRAGRRHPSVRRTHVEANAVGGAQDLSGIPLLALRRPGWRAEPGDRWTEVADAHAAAAALGQKPRRVFLTTGRLELPAFLAPPRHFYLVRSVDAPDRMPPRSRLVLARGPFAEEDELALMREERIDIVVTKNSGGNATYGKIVAARKLGLPVILLRRPEVAAVVTVATAEEAMKWVEGSWG